jgi:hypothetical protein
MGAPAQETRKDGEMKQLLMVAAWTILSAPALSCAMPPPEPPVDTEQVEQKKWRSAEAVDQVQNDEQATVQ